MSEQSANTIEDVSIHGWLMQNKMKNERGESISFYEHFFLYDIYADESPNLVVMKAAQVGMSVAEILRMFHKAKKYAFDIVYTLPTDGDVMDFVGGKVNRIIAQNPILQTYTADKDSVFQKHVGDSIVYFRSTFAKKKATMVTADWLIHDELDASKADVVEQYQSRTQHSKYKWRHVFSHPSLPGVGADAFWKKSDQKHWFIRCDGCKKEQYLDFPESICFERRVFQCKHCKKELTRAERMVGRWRARFKERKWSGYWVNLLMCPWVKAEEILEKWEDPDTTKEFFYNFIMGKAYASKDGTIHSNEILKNTTHVVNSQENVVIGCDVGNKKHYVVGNRDGLFYHGKTRSDDPKDWSEIEALMRMYPKAILVIDAAPDLTGPRILQEKFRGRVFLAYYQEDKKKKQLVNWGTKEEKGVVHIDRNRMLTHIVDEMKDGRIPLQGTNEDWTDYAKHWENIFRIKEEDKSGNVRYIWDKKSTEDHYCHATAYWRAGVSRNVGKGTIVKAESKVELPPSPVIQPDQTAQTPSHKQMFQIGTEDLGLD